MPLVPLQIPPGFHRNGTDMEGMGRWRDGNLVRWNEGSLRPIQGWQERIANMFTDAPRALFAWQPSADRWIAGGTYNSLKVATSTGTVYDITPSGLSAGREDAAGASGYGAGLYDDGLYGTDRSGGGTILDATTWSLDNWGSYLVACSDTDGRLFEWQLNTASDAAQIANSPTQCSSMFVTEERFIFALGANSDPQKVAWCDQEDNTVWTASSTNQAGSQILQTSGRIMCGTRTSGQSLIITDIDAHRAVYVGPPFVHRFERVGTSCGIISRKAHASTDAGVFWMGNNNFFVFDGSSVRSLPCEVWDYVFLDINRTQASKTWGVANGQNNEVWFFYPSSTSNEIDSYVAYDFRENHWLIGRLNRTAGFDRGVFSTPVYTDETGDVYNHETGYAYSGNTVFAESGPAQIGSGETTFNALQLIPDELTQGDVTVTFKTRFYPNAEERSFGPYSMANPTSIRFSGRQARIRVEGQTLDAWRWGIPRIEIEQAGKR